MDAVREVGRRYSALMGFAIGVLIGIVILYMVYL